MCVPIKKARTLKPCKDGFERVEKNGKRMCVPIKKARTVKPCKEGFDRVEKKGKKVCVPNKEFRLAARADICNASGNIWTTDKNGNYICKPARKPKTKPSEQIPIPSRVPSYSYQNALSSY